MPLQPLTGIDRELFETLIETPDLAGMAVEAIDPDWLETNTAKMLLSAYQDLELEGRDLDVQSVLLLLENEYLKNQVVSLDDRVRDREGKSTQSPEDRYTVDLAALSRARVGRGKDTSDRQAGNSCDAAGRRRRLAEGIICYRSRGNVMASNRNDFRFIQN